MTSAISYLIGTKQYGANKRMENLAWELANTAVNGHKNSDISFNAVEFPSQERSADGLNNIVYPVQGIQWKNKGAGSLQKTDNPFHLAIIGPGYFEMADGSYTRDGCFFPDRDGTLVSSTDGMSVLDVSGDPIVLPPGMRKEDFSVQSNGQIIDKEGDLLGQLKLVEFDDTNTLRPAGNNRSRNDEPPSPATRSQILQGSTESSNGQPMAILTSASSTKIDYQTLGAMSRRHDELSQQLTRQLLHIQA